MATAKGPAPRPTPRAPRREVTTSRGPASNNSPTAHHGGSIGPHGRSSPWEKAVGSALTGTLFFTTSYRTCLMCARWPPAFHADFHVSAVHTIQLSRSPASAGLGSRVACAPPRRLVQACTLAPLGLDRAGCARAPIALVRLLERTPPVPPVLGSHVVELALAQQLVEVARGAALPVVDLAAVGVGRLRRREALRAHLLIEQRRDVAAELRLVQHAVEIGVSVSTAMGVELSG